MDNMTDTLRHTNIGGRWQLSDYQLKMIWQLKMTWQLKISWAIALSLYPLAKGDIPTAVCIVFLPNTPFLPNKH